jgi:hypothetical protein
LASSVISLRIQPDRTAAAATAQGVSIVQRNHQDSALTAINVSAVVSCKTGLLTR